jgi:hypothetical protein
MQHIQGIKLVTGEELVAEIKDVSAAFIMVKDPLLMRMYDGPQGVVCNFSHWTVIADGDIPLNRDLVVAIYSIPKDVQDSYIQNTTGLTIVSGPSKQILNG